MFKIVRYLILVGLLAATVTLSVGAEPLAQTFYVAPNGNDSNPGTMDQPWRSVHKAATTATAGDTVLFQNGTYSVGSGESGWRSGTADSPITFKAINRREVTWKLESGGRVIDLLNVDHIRFIGLRLEGVPSATASRHVSIEDSSNILVEDCEIFNTQGHGVRIVQFTAGRVRNITIRNSTIHNDTASTILDGIIVQGGEDILIEGNEVYHTPHTGIAVKGAKDIIIRNNTVHDTHSHGISIGEIDRSQVNVLIANNIIYQVGTWDMRPTGSNKTGIRIHNKAEDVTITGNQITRSNGPGIGVTSGATGPIYIRNNYLYDNLVNCPDPNAYGSVFFGQEPGVPGTPEIHFEYNNVVHTQPTRTYNWNSDMEVNIFADFNQLLDLSNTEDIKRGGTSYDTYDAYQRAGFEPHTLTAGFRQYLPLVINNH